MSHSQSQTMLVEENPDEEVSVRSDLKPLTGFWTINVTRTVSFVSFIVCFFIQLISFGTPFWYVNETNDKYVSFGLWTTCETGFFSTEIECQKIHTGRPSQLTFDMRALQTNMTLALLANIMTFVLYIVWFRIGRGKGAITYLTPGTNGFGGLATIISVALYVDYFSGDLTFVGWSFILACVSGGLQLLTGLITLFIVPCVRA